MSKKAAAHEIETDIEPVNGLLDQSDIENLFKLNEFISARQSKQASLLEEIKRCILDSGKLSLGEWETLRLNLEEIEALIPTIDVIIQLKQEQLNG